MICTCAQAVKKVCDEDVGVPTDREISSSCASRVHEVKQSRLRGRGLFLALSSRGDFGNIYLSRREARDHRTGRGRRKRNKTERGAMRPRDGSWCTSERRMEEPGAFVAMTRRSGEPPTRRRALLLSSGVECVVLRERQAGHRSWGPVEKEEEEEEEEEKFITRKAHPLPSTHDRTIG